MKNTHQEKLLSSARARARQARFMHDGVAVYHCYGGEHAKTKSYWDDTGFQLGCQWVGVNFTHPRYMYEESCSGMAYDALKAQGKHPRDDGKLFENSTPVYKPVGKSRKKIHLYQMGEIRNRDFYDAWDNLAAEIKLSGKHVQRPHFNVTQCAWGRMVDICVPEEVLCEDDLVMLCDIVKACLADANYFKFKYGNYEYDCNDYKQENLYATNQE